MIIAINKKNSIFLSIFSCTVEIIVGFLEVVYVFNTGSSIDMRYLPVIWFIYYLDYVFLTWKSGNEFHYDFQLNLNLCKLTDNNATNSLRLAFGCKS